MVLNMDFKDCIKFANQTPVATQATAYGDQPRVRAPGFWFADENGIYFEIGATSIIIQDILMKPRFEPSHTKLFKKCFECKETLLFRIETKENIPTRGAYQRFEENSKGGIEVLSQ